MLLFAQSYRQGHNLRRDAEPGSPDRKAKREPVADAVIRGRRERFLPAGQACQCGVEAGEAQLLAHRTVVDARATPQEEPLLRSDGHAKLRFASRPAAPPSQPDGSARLTCPVRLVPAYAKQPAREIHGRHFCDECGSGRVLRVARLPGQMRCHAIPEAASM